MKLALDHWIESIPGHINWLAASLPLSGRLTEFKVSLDVLEQSLRSKCSDESDLVRDTPLLVATTAYVGEITRIAIGAAWVLGVAPVEHAWFYPKPLLRRDGMRDVFPHVEVIESVTARERAERHLQVLLEDRRAALDASDKP